MANPLLEPSANGLPRYDAVQPEHVAPGMNALLAQLGAEVDALEKSVTPTWAGVVEPLERIGDLLATRWGVVGHLLGVKNSPRAAHRARGRAARGRPVRAAGRTESADLRRARRAVEGRGVRGARPRAAAHRRRLLIRDARLAGVGLEGAALERFRAIADRARRAPDRVLEPRARRDQGASRSCCASRAEVDGPAGERARPGRAVRARGGRGERDAGDAARGGSRSICRADSRAPAREPPRSARAALPRERRAASRAPVDNTALIDEILRLRQRGGDAARLRELRRASPRVEDGARRRRGAATAGRAAPRLASRRPSASSRAARLRRARTARRTELALWDVAYWAERLREAALRVLRGGAAPVFPAARGARRDCSRSPRRLFDVSIRAADGEAPVWHPDVRFFRVSRRGGRADRRVLSRSLHRGPPRSAAAPGWTSVSAAAAPRRRARACRSPTSSATRRRRSAAKPSLMTLRRGARRSSTSSATACSTC